MVIHLLGICAFVIQIFAFQLFGYDKNTPQWDVSNSSFSPPAKIMDLRAIWVSTTAVKLTWTAPGDEGTVGMVASYSIRYTTFPAAKWEDMKIWTEERYATGPYGAGEEEIITGLDPEVFAYLFYIKALNSKGIYSEISNPAGVVKATTTVLLFHFNEGSGKPQDSSGFNNNAVHASISWVSLDTYTPTTWDIFSEKPETAIRVWGNRGVHVPPSLSIKVFPYGITVKFWVRQSRATKDTRKAEEEFVIGPDKAPGCSISLVGGTVTFSLMLDNGEVVSLSNTNPYTLDTWHFIAATYDNRQMRIYIDGTLDSYKDVPGQMLEISTAALRIGEARVTNREFEEIIDELEICNYAKTADEILTEYKRLRGLVPPMPITDLQVVNVGITTLSTGETMSTITLTWTTPADDGSVIAKYVIKYLPFPFSEAYWEAAASYEEAQSLIPKDCGEREYFTLSPFSCDKKYYFAIKSVDKHGNISPISNIVEVITHPDLISPQKPQEKKIILAGDRVEGKEYSVEPRSQVNIYILDPEKYKDAKPLFQTYADEEGRFSVTLDKEYNEIWLTVVDLGGNKSPSVRITGKFTPSRNALLPAYPNPFNPEEHTRGVVIPYMLKEDGVVSIKIFTAAGEFVKALLDNEFRRAGVYASISEDAYYRAAVWDGTSELGNKVCSGVYIYLLEVNTNYYESGKLLLIR
jgi:hypothetical protein